MDAVMRKAIYQGTYEILEPEAPKFSEGLEPSDAFLKRWKEAGPKRRLARRLAKMRINAGYTQAQVAEKLGIDPSYVSKMESSAGPVPKADMVAQLAAYYGYDTAYAFIERKNEGLELVLHNILRDEEGFLEMQDLQPESAQQ